MISIFASAIKGRFNISISAIKEWLDTRRIIGIIILFLLFCAVTTVAIFDVGLLATLCIYAIVAVSGALLYLAINLIV